MSIPACAARQGCASLDTQACSSLIRAVRHTMQSVRPELCRCTRPACSSVLLPEPCLCVLV